MEANQLLHLVGEPSSEQYVQELMSPSGLVRHHYLDKDLKSDNHFYEAFYAWLE